MKYLRPENIDELVRVMADIEEAEVTLLAGGTDLMPRYEGGLELPGVIIDIKRIDGLTGIKLTDENIEIGASTTVEEIRNHTALRNCRALVSASQDFAGKQIRNRATIGGNICNASPAGDLLPALYVFEAVLTLVNAEGERKVKISDFIKGPGKIGLQKDEIVKSISIARNRRLSYFYKLGLRDSMAISVVSFAMEYKYNDNEFNYLKIAAGAVAPTVVLLNQFTGSIVAEKSGIREKLALIDEDISPIDDIRATAKYRRTVLKNVIGYTLEAIAGGNYAG